MKNPTSQFLTNVLLTLLLTVPPSFAAEGDPAPNFSLPNMFTQDMVQLSDYKNKVILIDFWASWCGPCRASFPAYDSLRKELHREYGEDKFEIFAINVDMEKDEAFKFLREHPVSFPILDENTGGSTQHKYQILAMPTSFLVGPGGVIHVQHSGFSGAYIELIKKQVATLLKPELTKKL